jgi:Transposase and inactivated derivatives
MDIILYMIQLIQYQSKQISWLLNFICRYIPLKQWAFDDSHSPKYQKFKVDKLPIIKTFIKQDWAFLLEYYLWRYSKPLKPVQRRNGKTISPETVCPLCGAPHHYIYDNNGGNGQYQCKVCGQTFISGDFLSKSTRLICPYCSHSLTHKKNRKHFIVHKCINKNCSFYLHNLKKVDKEHLEQDYGKNKYKLHYIYREFTLDFFRMDLNSLPKNASSLKFSKHNSHIMSLCLTMHVNLGLSLRKTSLALKDLYNIKISHQQVANYARTAAIVIKPFVDNYDYNTGKVFTADETYIKVRGVKGYIWFIMDVLSRSIIGYQVSDNRGVGPCILSMRMAFRHIKELPEKFKFIADGYSAYPLAAQQFFREFGSKMKFDITQVIGLTNDDEVSKEFRPYKQMIERLNRTFKSSYRVRCGYDNFEGANYNVSLWVAYYNFLRPHQHNKYQVLNKVDMLDASDNMPGKWQLLIFLGQQTILQMQKSQAEGSICS